MFNWVDKQNIHELVSKTQSQTNKNGVRVGVGVGGDRKRNTIIRVCKVIEFYRHMKCLLG